MFYENYKAFLNYAEKKNRKGELNFFDFIIKYSENNGIIIPEVHNLEKIHQTYTWESGEKIIAAHPPEAIIKILEKVQAVPYKGNSTKPELQATNESVNQVIEQGNYTNLFLQTVGNQLTRIEKSVQKQTESLPSTSKKEVKPAFFKPIPDFKLKK